ncbi:MAG TPA: MFS transporter [Streptosporangiaceae bacterium]|nr:MFS transporter [Streptosporangiaceae bacterium]
MGSEADPPSAATPVREKLGGLARSRLGGSKSWSSFSVDLRAVLAGRDFRRLLGTRLISQTGDGMFTAGLGTYVFFNATSFPNPASAAAAFAVLYLPYSLIGPFAGVFIDRWSRRQILVWSALIRAVFVAVTIFLVISGSLGTPLYVAVLAVYGVNRFFLSSLSAALPHVVTQDKLVMANSVSTTSGTMVGFLGGFISLGIIHFAIGGRAGSAVTMLLTGACYLLAGAVAATMRRDVLGPDQTPRGQGRAGILAELNVVAAGLAAGARHVIGRRRAAAALLVIGCQRAVFGILFLMSILLYRNYFYHASANKALSHFSLALVAVAAGYAFAAVLIPMASSRLSAGGLITLLLTVAALVTGPLGATFSQIPFLVIGFTVGLTTQGVVITATTIIQREVEDSFRGRVFALWDMLFNVPYVAGAAVSAAFMPKDGKSYALVAAAAGGYLLAAVAYPLLTRQPSPSASSPDGSAPPSAASPSAAAQRNSS